jgi:hypothetical protein
MRALAKTAQWLGRISAITLLCGAALDAQTAALSYSTYLGGDGEDTGRAVAQRPGGGTCAAGTTTSLGFPTFLAGQPDPDPEPASGRLLEAFVTCFGSTGTLSYSTYLGGPQSEIPQAIAVAPDGRAFVTGFIDHFFEGRSAFLARARPFESIFLPFQAGPRSEGRDIAVDPAGNVYVTGRGFYQHPTFGLIPQAFVARVGSDGSPFYFTPLEGISGDERGNGVAVDTAGNAYAAGFTTSFDFPATSVLGPTLGTQSAFATKLDASGAIVYSILIGGSGADEIDDLAADAAGSVFVAGRTTSADFPLLDPAQASLRGANDLFLARFNPDGTLAASTYLGGSGTEEVTSLVLDGEGRLYLAGTTSSSDSPLSLSGCSGRFLSELDPASFEVLQATCLPGADVRDVAADQQGALHLTGVTSGGLPTVNAFQPQPAGGADAFAAKLAFNAPPDCSAAFASPARIWPPNGKLVPISIQGITDPEDDPITLTVTGVRQDEPLSLAGKPDATGIGTPSASLRADRAGQGDGRVYHLTFKARDPLGESCSGTIRVCVPHDQGRGRTCGDGGPLFDSAPPGG